MRIWRYEISGITSELQCTSVPSSVEKSKNYPIILIYGSVRQQFLYRRAVVRCQQCTTADADRAVPTVHNSRCWSCGTNSAQQQMLIVRYQQCTTAQSLRCWHSVNISSNLPLLCKPKIHHLSHLLAPLRLSVRPLSLHVYWYCFQWTGFREIWYWIR